MGFIYTRQYSRRQRTLKNKPPGSPGVKGEEGAANNKIGKVLWQTTNE